VVQYSEHRVKLIVGGGAKWVITQSNSLYSLVEAVHTPSFSARFASTITAAGDRWIDRWIDRLIDRLINSLIIFHRTVQSTSMFGSSWVLYNLQDVAGSCSYNHTPVVSEPVPLHRGTGRKGGHTHVFKLSPCLNAP